MEHAMMHTGLRRLTLAVAVASLAAAACAAGPGVSSTRGTAPTMNPITPSPKPLVIAHRGASGYVPEHTLAAYAMAIAQGAEAIEPDLVSTKDGVLVARHENAIASLNPDGTLREATTDVAERPEFASRKTTKTIDGVAITGWFTEDFTLAELKTLRAKERLPTIRPANMRFDGMFEIPTFEEVLRLAAQENARRALTAGQAKGWRPLSVYPETKHPTFFRGIGLPLEETLVKTLDRYGYTKPDSAVFIQSFETANLKQLRAMTRVPIVQLLNTTGQPYDFTVSGDPRTYADLAKPEGLAGIAAYANGIGVNTAMMIPLLADGRLGTPTTLVSDAHNAGLIVHGWTFRAENNFLPTDFDIGTDPAALGDLAGQIKAFLALGMDGFFTDHAFLGRQARDDFIGGTPSAK
jgi:glycerophosphoryl diester phosphodiesterase